MRAEERTESSPSLAPVPNACVHELFEAWARLRPEAVALVCGAEEVTYGELDTRSNRLANLLRSRSIGRGSRVGICLDRSIDMVVALLSILKVGAAYVPIDRSYPDERIRFIVDDTRIAALVSRPELAAQMPVESSRVIGVGRNLALFASTAVASGVSPAEPAYVMYTSGSTGVPKGVEACHRGVVRLFFGNDYVHLDSDQVSLHLSSPSFDASTFELWSALLHGGRVVLWSDAVPDPYELGRVIAANGVTVLWLTASLFNTVIDASPEALASVRQLLVGGEALSPGHVHKAQQRLPHTQIVNGYGPTESTTFTCCYRIPKDLGQRASIPIGRPIANTKVYVLDADMAPTRVRVPGELLIGGDGLARGYLNRPELTAEKFVPDPFDGEGGRRLYRTGDVVRWLPDGNLEFTGRVDQQVKLRGYRVEPGEIEMVLARHPDVREVVVDVRQDSPGDKRLVAYVVPGLGSSTSALENHGLESARVDHWQTLYEDTYAQGSTAADPAFNVVGWESSYTGEPIPDPEMREWRRNTVDRIRSLAPEEVLEIGCGTGLLLLELAPDCRRYCGTDFSRRAVAYVGEQLARSGLDHVTLLQRLADDFDDMEPESFDTVILNSVIQYFPGCDYLLRVLEGAVRVTRPGGHIFVGDVRNLALLRAFHASVELSRARATLPCARLRERVLRQASQEGELLVSPGFFSALEERWDGIRRAEALLKRGRFHNELTRFRYDVVLEVGPQRAAGHSGKRNANNDDVATMDDVAWLDWEASGQTHETLRRRLAAGSALAVGLRNVPNARVSRAFAAWQRLSGPSAPKTAAVLEDLLPHGTELGLDPEDLWSLGEELGYRVNISWQPQHADGSYDVVFQKVLGAAREGRIPWIRDARPASENASWRAFTNDPVRAARAESLVPVLRRLAEAKLPDYMVPSAFVLLEELPLNASGKLDRRALPAPLGGRPELESEYTAPRNEIEATLVRSWEEVLGVDQVGVDDDFFALGGHSLLATQLISRVREAFGVELPLRELFNEPTVAGLARAIGTASRGVEVNVIERRSPSEELELSFAQQRLWFLDQLIPQSPLYNVPAAVRVKGAMDRFALHRSLKEIVRRHESLRTRFEALGGRARQVVEPSVAIGLGLVDLEGLEGSVRDEETSRLVREESRRPFDLSRGPLIRWTMVRLGAEEHVVLLTMHHIVSDGWSIGVVIGEVAALYEALSLGRPSPLPELSVQYADYSAWQRRHFQGELLERQLSYWREQLAGSPALSLPTDRPRPTYQSYRGKTKTFRHQGPMVKELRELSRREGATLFMTLLAGFDVVLSRYSGEEDVVVGTPIANRTRSELEPMIGFFVNTLVLRGDLSGGPRFTELLGRVRNGCLEAYAHQDLPFEKLVEELDPARDLSREPLFQVLFAVQNAPMPTVTIPGGLSLTPMEVDSGTSKFDLSLHFWEAGEDGLHGMLEYSVELFDDTTMERLLKHLEVVLGSLSSSGERRVGELPMLSLAEQHQLTREWTATRREHAYGCSHELFESVAGESPDAVALVFEDEALSYGELNRVANGMASRLRLKGVGPESVVGIAVGRSPDMAAVLLGVLKAGAAYVPLDPGYPPERLRFMLRDSGASLVVTDEERADWGEAVELAVASVRVEEIWASKDESPVSGVGPEHLAYVIYTSGSTGRPKGIALGHAALSNLVEWHQESLMGGGRTLQYASLSFDASFHEFFATWRGGGTVYVVDEELRRDVGALSRYLQERGIEKAIFPVVVLQRLAEEYVSRRERPAELREVVTTGEQLQVSGAMKALFSGLSGRRLHNHYGPSESHVVTSYRLDGDPQDWAFHPWIGRGIWNTELYVLDRKADVVPIGVVGELYIGGVCLARGYVGRAELTAERFVPNGFTEVAGERLYATGDLARYRFGGHLEYLGRRDHQVKVRGYRVEPGEVESVLADQAEVEEAAVVIRGEGDDRHLVAYVVSERRDEPWARKLKEELRKRLPEYMIPRWVVGVDALPLTPNGKVDRAALPAVAARMDAGEYVAPRTQTEAELSRIWAEVLGVSRVGVTDNFFELGGHSLLATQLVSRIRERYEVELPLREVFEEPTVARLASVIDARHHVVRPVAVTRADRGSELPLSFGQQRLWFLDQLIPQSPLYNVPAAVRVKGAMDRFALHRSLKEIVRRHESLRTRFEALGGRARQVVEPSVAIGLGLVDLEGLEGSVRDEETSRLVREESRRPFDLSRGPLVRWTMVRLGAEEHVVLLTMHHIVSDGWSIGVVIGEVAALYEALSLGRPSPLPELSVQYADYSAWQRRHFQGELLERQLSYWREQLAGSPALSLPTDRPRPTYQSYRGKTKTFRHQGPMVKELRELSRREGATLFMTLLAGFDVVLSRYSGEEDVVVGTPIANRTRSELEPMIGFFVNTLVLRGDLSGGPRFTELLGRVRDGCLEAYAHQDLPFEKLVEELDPERDLRRDPLFQVLFAVQNAPMPTVTIPGGLSLTPMEVDSGTSKFDLSLHFWEAGEDGLHGMLEYSVELFDDTTMERLLKHLEVVLGSLSSSGERRVGELPLLSLAERHQLTREWPSSGDSAVGSERSLAEAYGGQARFRPESIAVVDGAHHVSYQELDRRSNRIAALLEARGIGREDRVGVCTERGLGMVTAILGVLKSGGAYVPLDPAYPGERLRYVVEDSKARVVLTEPETFDRVSTLATERVSLADGEGAWPESDRTRKAKWRRDQTAYVIYTSGSTGRPKGVEVTHGNALSLFESTRSDFGFSEVDRWSLFHSYAFDFSVWELWGALLHGGCAILVPYEVSRSPEDFHALVSRERVTVLSQTPTAFQQLMEVDAERGGESPLDLRWVVFGGEALPIPSLGGWMERHGEERPRLVNMYGITETTVHVTRYRLRLEDVRRARGSVIGRGIRNWGVYVLERDHEPAPAGVVGELYVRGRGVTRGYLGRPASTAERFLPDAQSGESGARLYRTGDLGRWLPDGRLVYVGRADHQVKVRGYRIELGEIESVLRAHPSVRECVVVGRPSPQDLRLVAYVVREESARPVEESEIRDHLRSHLPDYMVPSVVGFLESLPVLPSGKVDRSALPDLGGARPDVGEYVAARTPVEAEMAQMWSEVLGVSRVGITDNFFELGGHSLLATQLVSRIRNRYQVEIPLLELFQWPTVATLAAALERSKVSDTRPPLRRRERTGTVPLSFAQQRLWFLDQLVPGSPSYNMAGALRLTGELDLEAMHRALNEILRRHESLRTSFRSMNARPVQAIEPSVEIRVPVVDLRELPEERRQAEVERLVAEEARLSIDLKRAPLLRARLLWAGDEDHVACLTLHHIVSDGWSLGVMVGELATLYAAYHAGKPSPLPELPVQYADFAEWQHEWLRGEELERLLGYWRKQLEDLPTLHLPTDRVRQSVERFRGAQYPFAWSKELLEALKDLSHREGVTLFMVLMASFQLLLSRLSGQVDVAMGSPIANRTRAELEPLIGFFVNTLVLRTDLSGDPSFRELLGRVRKVCLDAYAHQDLPFERLVQELEPERTLSRESLFQVMFALQNAPMAPIELPGLTLTPLHADNQTAKFDQTWFLWDTPAGLRGSLEYSTDLFDEETIAWMVDEYGVLLERVVAQPGARLSELTSLSDSEQTLLLEQWSQPRSAGPPAPPGPEQEGNIE